MKFTAYVMAREQVIEIEHMRDGGYGWQWVLQLLLELFFVFPFLSSPQPEQELQTAPSSITQGDSVNNQSEESAEEQSPSGEQGEAIFRPQ